jgi:hypothetical protein
MRARFLVSLSVPLLLLSSYGFAGSTDILSGSVAVPALKWVRYPVTVTPSMLHPRLSGRLTATGGTGNDIVVTVMGDVDFTNWANGHPGAALYNSGQVTAADVKVDFPEPGVYVVALDNKFSSMTAKTVEGRLRLLWDDPPPPPVAKATTAPAKRDNDDRPSGRPYLGMLAVALLGVLVG